MIGRISSVGHSVLALSIGLLFLAQPPSRLVNPNFAFAKKFWEHAFGLGGVSSMRLWGAIFLVLGMLCAFTFAQPRVRWVFSLLAGCYALFAFSLYLSAEHNPQLSYTGGVFCAVAAFSVINTSLAVEADGAQRPSRVPAETHAEEVERWSRLS